ncbi:MAG TPA: hypothetical protein PK156_45365, partial [Polyangium sp.]|nr:hypothetical protein [Polyangium sp.]
MMPDRTGSRWNTMTEKNTDDNKATSANKEAGAAQDPTNTPMPPSTESSAALGSTPPPPTAGTRTKSLPVPRGPRPSSRPGASVRPKGSEDEIFSIFNAAANKVPDDLTPAPMSKPPEPMSEKPKSQLGSRTEEREVTRSRSIPIDEDLFNLSVGLFSNPQQGPIVSPDMSALTGSSDKTAGKDGPKSAFDDLLFTPAAAPVAPLDSLASLAPKAAAPEPAKPSAPKSNKGVLFGGILVGVALASGVFFAMQRSQPIQQPTASNQTPTTTDNGLDTRPGQKTATEEPRAVAPGEKPKDEPAAAGTDKPADTSGTTPAAAG